MTPDKLALAMEGCELLAQFAHLHKQRGDPEKASHITKRVLAMQELVALWTPKDRPTEPGVYIREMPTGHRFLCAVSNAEALSKFFVKDMKWFGPLPLPDLPTRTTQEDGDAQR